MHSQHRLEKAACPDATEKHVTKIILKAKGKGFVKLGDAGERVTSTARTAQTPYGVMSVAILVNSVSRAVATVGITVARTKPTAAAMRPYSMAVAPESSFIKCISLLIFILLWIDSNRTLHT